MIVGCKVRAKSEGHNVERRVQGGCRGSVRCLFVGHPDPLDVALQLPFQVLLDLQPGQFSVWLDLVLSWAQMQE